MISLHASARNHRRPTTLKKSSSTKSQKSKKSSSKNKRETADDNTLCGYCGQKYNAAGDEANDDWLQCMKCSMWLHETCAEEFGVIGDDDFFCSRCCA